MKMKPIGERVLIKPIMAEEKTASGIIISSSTEKEKPNFGQIIALGKGEKLEDLKVGDQIVYAKYSGTEVKDENDEKYIVLNIDDVLAIVE